MADQRDNSAEHMPADRKAPLGKLAAEMVGMSPWKKKLLGIFVVVAVVGLALRLPAYFRGGESQNAPSATDASAPPEGSRGFIDSSRTDRGGDEARAPGSTSQSLSLTARLGGWMAKLGGSFAGGLLIGIFFRAFVKTMAAITAVVVAGIAGLAWFDVIDADSLRRGTDSFAGWASDSGSAARNFLMRVLPSAGSGAAGFFVGLLKK